MSGLTLPLRTGQKCVTRDGRKVTIGGYIRGGAIGVISDDQSFLPYCVRKHDGLVSPAPGSRYDVTADQADTPQPVRKGHPHAESMAEFAVDASKYTEPWRFWQYLEELGGPWKALTGMPHWDANVEYRRKPRTININGHKVPEPLRVAPPLGTVVYLPGLESHTENLNSLSIECMPDLAGEWFKANLARGILHATREAAEAHARALLSFTEVKS